MPAVPGRHSGRKFKLVILYDTGQEVDMPYQVHAIPEVYVVVCHEILQQVQSSLQGMSQLFNHPSAWVWQCNYYPSFLCKRCGPP